jgi:outer membrane lipoprotein-sorting protein
LPRVETAPEIIISDRHSLTVFDVEREQVLLRQIDERGNEIDRIRVTA